MPTFRRFALGLLLALLLIAPAEAQTSKSLSVEVEPTSLSLGVGEAAQLQARVVNAEGAEQEAPLLFFSRSRRAVGVDSTGQVMAFEPGSFSVIALTRTPEGETVYTEVPVEVAFPAIEEVSFVDPPQEVYTGTRVPIEIEAKDATGSVRENLEGVDPASGAGQAVRYTSSNPDVLAIDAAGRLSAKAPGTATVTAEVEGVRATTDVRVIENPVARVELRGGADQARTGDVLAFEAVPIDAEGQPVEDAPVLYAVQAQPDDNLGPAATGQITQDGRFVAEAPGDYTVVATSGPHHASTSVRVTPREVQREIEVVGRGAVTDVHTSDLWVWEGVDGRDYAVTGTWGANGEAYFWDVTDPANPTLVDTVTVDARTVNDVKVSEDGTVCVISREGASNRRNGLVILDCTDPTDVQIHAAFDDELTGGVHNVFIYKNHVYAVNNGRRYDIISIENPKEPRRVGRFELDTRGHALHDVWIEDGIAYSSNWDDGVVMVDVGNGIAGGSPSNPVQIGQYAYPSGWNHAAFPYKDESTGKFYIIAGDEAFPYGLHTEDEPTRAAGWLHFIDFTDPENPQEVARYEVPEAGTHNFWVDGDTLYVAYYNGGFRVVDLSGELLGDLYRQGREVARFVPSDPEGYIPNAPMTWGPQPYKGNIFLSDWNSGLWVVKLSGGEEAKDAL